MTNKEIVELTNYYAPQSILVVTWQGKLKVLNTPFRVKVLQNIGKLLKNSIQNVQQVKISRSGRTVYLIHGKPYFYSYFAILIGKE